MMEWKDFPYRHLLPYGVTVLKIDSNTVFNDNDSYRQVKFPSYDMTADDVKRMVKLL